MLHQLMARFSKELDMQGLYCKITNKTSKYLKTINIKIAFPYISGNVGVILVYSCDKIH
jgi:hypothetical protein